MENESEAIVLVCGVWVMTGLSVWGDARGGGDGGAL